MNATKPLGVAVTVLLLSSVIAAPVAAATMLEASPNEADARATHAAVAAVGPDDDSDSWNGLNVDYQNTTQNGDVKDVDEADVKRIGIDREGDDPGATIDVDVSDDLSGVKTSNNGETLAIRLGGVYNLQKGDEVVVVYDDAMNPAAGEYRIDFTVNPQSGGTTSSATMTIVEESDATSTATATPTPDDGETATPTPTDAPLPDDEPTPTTDDGDDTSSSAESSTGSTGEDGGATETADDAEDTPDATDAADTADATDAADDATSTSTGDADDGAALQDQPSDGDGPGFGVLAALVALLGVALLARR